MDHKDMAAIAIATKKKLPTALEEVVKYYKADTKNWLKEYYQAKIPDTDVTWIMEATQCVATSDGNVRCPNPAVGVARLCTECQQWEAPGTLYGQEEIEALRDWDIRAEMQEQWMDNHCQPMEDTYVNILKRHHPNCPDILEYINLRQNIQEYLHLRQNALRQLGDSGYGQLYEAYGKPLLTFDANGCSILGTLEIVLARRQELKIIEADASIRETILGPVQMATPDIWQGAEDMRDDWARVNMIVNHFNRGR